MDKIKFKNTSAEQYEPTDSENDYSEEEKELLQEVRKGRQRDQSKQREVLAFTESEDEDDDGDDEEVADDDDDDEGEDDMGLADSDIEGAEQNENDLPDTKYWGKKSGAYYNTDFVDQDYSSYNEKEEELAKLEEVEAKAIQLRLAKQLKEEDFALDSTFSKLKKSKENKSLEDSTVKSTLLKSDFSGLGKRERLELFEKDSPEFSGLIGDFEGYLEEVQQLHAPVLNYVKQNKIPMIPCLQFAQHYQNIAMTYCSNLTFYLLLKAKRSSIENHPIVQRLTQLKKLLNQLEDKHENIVKPQLEALLERIQDGDQFEILDMKDVPPAPAEKQKRSTKQSQLGILNAYEDKLPTEDGPSKKKSKLEGDIDHDLATLAAEMSSDDNDGEDDDEMGAEEEDEEAEARRGITYQISKNKGLMPHRKKEQRNPRVKHRGKYRKALIRRKGAVRTVRTETSRYGGEMSGIKATVSKSIKFRS